MTVELSNRHWVHFRHPRSEFEYRVRLVKTPIDVDAVFEVQRRDATLGESDKWESVYVR